MENCPNRKQNKGKENSMCPRNLLTGEGFRYN
jgi:hypothetical protein